MKNYLLKVGVMNVATVFGILCAFIFPSSVGALSINGKAIENTSPNTAYTQPSRVSISKTVAERIGLLTDNKGIPHTSNSNPCEQQFEWLEQSQKSEMPIQIWDRLEQSYREGECKLINEVYEQRVQMWNASKFVTSQAEKANLTPTPDFLKLGEISLYRDPTPTPKVTTIPEPAAFDSIFALDVLSPLSYAVMTGKVKGDDNLLYPAVYVYNGESWVKQDIPAQLLGSAHTAVYGAWIFDKDDIYVVSGAESNLLHYNGTTWEREWNCYDSGLDLSGDITDMDRISDGNGNYIYYALRGGRVLRKDTATKTWSVAYEQEYWLYSATTDGRFVYALERVGAYEYRIIRFDGLANTITTEIVCGEGLAGAELVGLEYVNGHLYTLPWGSDNVPYRAKLHDYDIAQQSLTTHITTMPLDYIGFTNTQWEDFRKARESNTLFGVGGANSFVSYNPDTNAFDGIALDVNCDGELNYNDLANFSLIAPIGTETGEYWLTTNQQNYRLLEIGKAPDPEIRIVQNQSVYHGGDRITVKVKINNIGHMVYSDVYAALKVGEDYYLWSSWINANDLKDLKQIGEHGVTIPAGAEKEFTLIDTLLPENLSSGDFEWVALAVAEDTLKVIGNVAVEDFSFR